MVRYGSDKPERRIALEIVELSDVLRGSEFKVFAGALSSGGVVRGLPIHDAAALTRSELDRLNEQARGFGAKGLAWVRIAEDGSWQSPIAKFLTEEEKAAISERAGLRRGSVILFGADRERVVCDVLGRLRLELGQKLGRYDGRAWDPHFVVGFPLFEADDDGKLTYMHMPFVAPLESELEKLDSDPKSVVATHYDLVMNGVELGSGSLRNHRSDVQLKILEILGYSEAQARADFGFMLDALDTGAPPHGGFAFGFDRLALMLAGGESLRDVIAFPKTQRAQDSFMESPSAVDAAQLKELGLRLRD
jgi:aspartyl-tRNA synthetase